MNQMPDADGSVAFATACRQLERIARINHEGLQVCLELHLEEPDLNTSRMLAESAGYALSQVAYLLRPLLLLAIDTECANAATERQAVGE